jgi:hypothetical protein
MLPEDFCRNLGTAPSITTDLETSFHGYSWEKYKIVS